MKKERSTTKNEKLNAFIEMARVLDEELKAGKHTEHLAEAVEKVQGLDRYSPLNQLLILEQCPHATEVAGFVQWQERGYHVMRGESGIAIRAPHEIKAEKDDGEEGRRIGFHRTYVWDISQVSPVENKQEKE